jgi:hypothetical protein
MGSVYWTTWESNLEDCSFSENIKLPRSPSCHILVLCETIDTPSDKNLLQLNKTINIPTPLKMSLTGPPWEEQFRTDRAIQYK